MRSWPTPGIPHISGQGPPLRLFDTATQEIRPTAPGPRATMYVCGITPYDATHIGHAATYVAFDLVNRLWRDVGHEVLYAQNVTDVDDPLLERAVATGQDWRAVAEKETEFFRADMTALGVIPPDHYIGAVESIPAIVQTIVELQAQGAVYKVDDDLYYSVDSKSALPGTEIPGTEIPGTERSGAALLNPTAPESATPGSRISISRFGQISNLARPRMLELFAERGGDPARPGKRDPLDPLLWQAERAGEPAWESEFGKGRPGWHVECAAIATEYLGMPIDLQGGGSDLIFPHHEMTAAMADTAENVWPFARHNVHTGMVGLDGHKMSKSRGNLVFVRTLRERGHDPNAVRLALLAHHYRSDWEWTATDLTDAEERLSRWSAAVGRESAPSATTVIARMRDCLTDDLNTAGALRAIDDWAADTNYGIGDNTDATSDVRAALGALIGVQL